MSADGDDALDIELPVERPLGDESLLDDGPEDLMANLEESFDRDDDLTAFPAQDVLGERPESGVVPDNPQED